MTDFELTIQFTQRDTEIINRDGLMLGIAKAAHFGTELITIWAGFQPFEKNIVTWKTTYGVYASTTAVQQDAMIEVLSQLYPADPDVVYPFENHVFGTTSGSAQPNNYAIENRDHETFTFGLLQEFSVNGQLLQNPVNALALLGRFRATFHPTEKILVFLHKQVTCGTLIAPPTDGTLIVDMAAQPKQTIHCEGLAIKPGPLD